MTIIYAIRNYDEILAVFSTRERAEKALELRVCQNAARGAYGLLNTKPDLEWRGGLLGFTRVASPGALWPGWSGWHAVSEEIEEVELDDVPWKSELSEEEK